MTNQAPDVSPDEFDEIDAILDDLRERNDETPQWEFCEGVMAALICSRRAISADEYLDVLLGVAPETVPTEKPAEELSEFEGSFADAAQRQRFMDIWTKRWAEIASALAKEIESLDDENAYQPEVMDVRGAIASFLMRSVQSWVMTLSPPLPRSGLWGLCLWWKTGPKSGRPQKIKTQPSGWMQPWSPSLR